MTKSNAAQVVEEISVSVNTAEEPKNSSFHVQVLTKVPNKDVVVDSRICDIYNFQSRKWLTNHQFWAMHQGHTVELHPATPDEVQQYTQRQAQLLSNRYGSKN